MEYEITLPDTTVEGSSLDIILSGLPENTPATAYGIKIMDMASEVLKAPFIPSTIPIEEQEEQMGCPLCKILRRNPAKYVRLKWDDGYVLPGSNLYLTASFGMCGTLVGIKLPRMGEHNLDSFFYKCSNLVEADIEHVIDSPDKYSFFSMFYKNTSLTTVRGFFVPSSNWDESEDIGMFRDCSSLESIYVRKSADLLPPPSDAGAWRSFAVSHGSGTDDTVTVYATDSTVEASATVTNADGRSVEATDWVDELALSDTEIPGSKVADMMSSRIPVTGNAYAVDPSVDNFVLWSKDGDRKKINLHMSDLRNDLSLSDFTNDLSLSDFTNDLVLPVGRPANVRPGSVWLG